MRTTATDAAGTFFWHDYETTGRDPGRDRPLQFAGLRTSLDLEPIDAPVMVYCKPAPDVLPHPAACLITGITPQQAEREGLIEAEFTARVNAELAEPGTCGVGYNSLRFDDVFTRNLLYRNFHDPYEREWKDGNSRWDLIDLARMCYALRPDGIEWPRRADGSPSFRLEDLASANHLHHQAHDALSDVEATLAMARLIRARQPRLWDWHLAGRRKQQALQLLDIARMTPLVHVSSRYPAERGCLAIVAPIAEHPSQGNAVIVFDLATDPTDLIELDADEIADRMFTPRADLPEDVARIPLKLIRANHAPALAPMSVLRGVDCARIGLDSERGLARLEQLRAADGLAEKVRRVFARGDTDQPTLDPELALYAGFADAADKRLMREVRATPPAQLGQRNFPFHDARYAELLFRYRARNWPETLDLVEQKRWDAFRRRRLDVETPLTTLTLDQYFATIAALRDDPLTAPDKLAVLDALESWGRNLS